MQINITARHGEVSDLTRDKIVSKVEKLSRFLDRITAMDVIVDLDPRENPKVEVQIHTEFRKEFFTQTQAGELFASLDEATRKLEQQLKKYKEKMISSHRGNAPQE